MKNRKRSSIIALMLMLAMIITSEALVFAADGVADQPDQDLQVEEQAAPAGEEVTEPQEPAVTEGEEAVNGEDAANEDADGAKEEADGTGLEDADGADDQVADEFGAEETTQEEAAFADGDDDAEEESFSIKEIKAYPGYKSITVRWTRVDGAKYYILKRSTKKSSGFKELKTIKESDSSKYVYEKNPKKMSVRDAKQIEQNKRYYYRVYAVKKVDGKEVKSEPAKANEKSVRQMYEDITFKTSRTLTSHDSAHKTRTFSAGTTVTADGFGGGKYKFSYKGNYFFVSYTSIGKAKADYLEKTNYAKATVENFINEAKDAGLAKKGKGNYLVWVSTYTQHLYVFKYKNKKWELYKDFECSTGKALSPTPTSALNKDQFEKKIHTKTYSYSNNIPYWMMFQSYNSIHGKKPEYKIGLPASHGCVRNYNSNAKWMYNDAVVVGTPVVIF
jgi:lipoprotein-anchoring transpeptidase ErfK/SrfK